jgi:hypothetical protein
MLVATEVPIREVGDLVVTWCLCYICDHDLADYTIRCPDTSLCLYNGARSPENDCVDRLSRFAVIVIG